MKKMYFKTKHKLFFSFLFLAFLFLNATYAQQTESISIGSNEHNHLANEFTKTTGNLTISYTEKIPFDGNSLTDLKNASWAISNEKGFVKQGRGEDLANYAFNTPGNYTIDFSISQAFTKIQNSCYHPSLPSKLLLEVKPYRLTFNFDTFKLSSDITAGADTTGSQLSIQAKLESYNGSPLLYNQEMTTAGIQTTVVGKVNSELLPGNNNLTFELEGVVKNANTYIMFDFIDAKDNIQSYALTKPIR